MAANGKTLIEPRFTAASIDAPNSTAIGCTGPFAAMGRSYRKWRRRV